MTIKNTTKPAATTTTTPLGTTPKAPVKETRKSWPDKPSLASFIRGLGLGLKPGEALAKALAAGYVGATVKSVYVAQSDLRRIAEKKMPARARRGTKPKVILKVRRTRPEPSLRKFHVPRSLTAPIAPAAPLTDEERVLTKTVMRIGVVRASALVERVALALRQLGI